MRRSWWVAAPVALLLLVGTIFWVRAARPDSATMPASDHRRHHVIWAFFKDQRLDQ
jgi:hypothetical protein